MLGIRRKKKSSATGLVAKFLLAGAVLHYAGAGEFFKGTQPKCNRAMEFVGGSSGQAVCGGVSQFFDLMDRSGAAMVGLLETLADKAQYLVAHGKYSPEELMQFQAELVSQLGQGQLAALQPLMSPSEDLIGKIGHGPSGVDASAPPSDRLRELLDSFVIGKKMLHEGTSGDATEALAWLQQGASDQEGYGVFAQLSLGDAYNTGASGVVADPKKSSDYYLSAADSITKLQGLNTPEAQSLLQGLPMDPEQMKKKLMQAARQITAGMKH